MSLCNGALLVLIGFAKQRRGCGVVRSDIVIELGHLFGMFSYLASWERYSYFQPWTQGSKHVTNGRENPAILSKGMFGEEWWESVLFSLCPYPQPLDWFHKGKEGGEKSVRISQMKSTSTLTEIDCFLLRNLVMVTIIFLNLSSCL